LSNTAIDLLSAENLRQDAPTRRDSQHPSAFVRLLDDDSTLIIFSFCRPVILDAEGQSNDSEILGGGEWHRERWWHRLIQVCRRWRYLILDSAFHLQVSLVCGRGTPVADMLAHSPPTLPLIIDHFDDEYQDLTAEEEKGIILALQHRDRVRRIRIIKPTPILQKLIVALEGEFPILEFLLIWHQRYLRPVIVQTDLNLPETFRAPNLRHLLLKNFATQIESPQLMTMGNLVTLFLTKIPFSACFQPNDLLQRLSLMPQLEALWTGFNFGSDFENQLLRTPTMTRVTLPNLRWLGFQGYSAYCEVLLSWLTTPLLEKLRISFFNRMIYSIPHLRQFMDTVLNFQVKTVRLQFFAKNLWVVGYPHMGASLHNLSLDFGRKHLDLQVISAAQIFHALSTVFSVVEHLTLEYKRSDVPLEWNDEADRTDWRRLLGSFGKVQTLSIDGELVEQLSGALQPGEEESPTELLPELRKLSHSASGDSRNAFTQFVDARQKAGRPVTVVHI